jgi:hypothetical protein
MAAFTRVNGAAASMEQVGRDLFIQNFSGISTANVASGQAALESLVTAIQATATITAIGDFTAGTSGNVNMIIEGAEIAAGANSPITGITCSNTLPNKVF